MKTCSECGLVKPLSQYYGDSKGGTKGQCKPCYKAVRAPRQKEYYRSNAEKVKARVNARWTSNPDAAREYAAMRRRLNPDYNRMWRQANRASDAATRHRRRAVTSYAPLSAMQWRQIVDAYDGLCAYCSSPSEHLEHIIPLSKGGQHDTPNVVPACAPCNLSKATRDPIEWFTTRYPGAPLPECIHIALAHRTVTA